MDYEKHITIDKTFLDGQISVSPVGPQKPKIEIQ
jgi:hypothetical protein